MTEKKSRRSEEILRPDWLIDPADRDKSSVRDELPAGEDIHIHSTHRAHSKTAEMKEHGSRPGRSDKGYHRNRNRRPAGQAGDGKKHSGIGVHERSERSESGLAVFLSTISGALSLLVSAASLFVVRLMAALKDVFLDLAKKTIAGGRYLYGRLSGHNDAYGHAAGSEQSNIAKQNDNPGQSHSYGQTWEKKAEEEARIRTRKLSERSLDRREQQLRRHYVFLGILILLLILGVRGIVYRVNTAKREQRMEQELEAEREGLSAAVLGYEDTVKSYAKANGLSEYVDILMAIMEVESKGLGNDVMQSSESMGLAAGSLEPEESISQACVYWGRLLKIADSNDCDIRSVIQAYNFGPGYLTYVAENNGGKYSEETAIEFARQQSGGETVTYTNEIAVQKNGGWMYSYGNMFYEELVEQYLPEGWDAEYD